MATNENIDAEIESPLTRERLHAIQGIVTLIDTEQLKAREELEQRRGMAKAATYIAERIMQERIPLRRMLDAGEVSSEESTIRKRQIDAIAEVVTRIAVDNTEDVKKLKGVVEGLARAGTTCASKFDREVATHRRHMTDTEMGGEEPDELGRTAKDRADLAGLPAPLRDKPRTKAAVKKKKKKRTRKSNCPGK